MIKKIALLIALTTCAIGNSAASQVTLNQLEEFDVDSFVYVQSEIPRKLYEGASHFKLAFRFNEGLEKALGYIDSINTVSPLSKQVMGAYMKMSALVMQNAENSKYIQEKSHLVSSVAQCLYFGIDDEVKFHINKSLSLLVGDDVDRDRFIVGMARAVQLAPFQTNQSEIRDLIMSCSESTNI
ncbi:TPA: hypothetical protein I7730_14445 [Vibrio vulnificus]|uniref:Uncharacterized protein n=1 Tax=Vibrio vulnificus TaxID=672 RepID=A0A8H9N197_VIBVL|nr:hypothetical protein [Vibrio vulnificus]HAS8540987.1 hypothetical protein [Vibrio vulnificus]